MLWLRSDPYTASASPAYHLIYAKLGYLGKAFLRRDDLFPRALSRCRLIPTAESPDSPRSGHAFDNSRFCRFLESRDFWPLVLGCKVGTTFGVRRSARGAVRAGAGRGDRAV